MSLSVVTRRDVVRLAVRLGILSVPAVVAPGVVARAAALARDVLPGSPWFVPSDAFLLYVLVPLVSLSACVLVLAPGLFLTQHPERSAPEWLFRAFAVSVGVVSVITGVAQAVLPVSLNGRLYALLLVASGAVAGAIVWWSAPVQRRSQPRTSMQSDTARELGLLVVGALVAYYAFSPKLLFEAFNGDGAHAFESSRLLLRHALPFWPDAAGPVAGFPGVTSMLFAFPNAWFLRLFGEVEFAVRVPFLLYLPVVGAGILSLARAGREDGTVDFITVFGVVMSLACYAVAMAFSATYSTYSADIALPATQDTLLMIAWLGAAIASFRREYGWLAWFVALTFMSLPSGVIMIGFLLVARLLAERPRPWQSILVTGTLLLACMVIAALLPRILIALGAAPPGGEYGAAGILRYFAFLQFTDLSRLLYVALPAGIFPLLVLLAWKAQDSVGRALTLVTVAYFVFFFVQAQVSLHHFVPAMIVPIVIAARVADRQPLLGMAWLAVAIVALVLVLPERAIIHVTGREVGGTIVERVGDYRASDPAVFRASTLLDRVFPYDWDPAVPAQSYGGSPLVWNHYARHQGSVDAQTNYILQPATDPVPAGWHRVAWESGGAALLLRSQVVLDGQLAVRPPTPAGTRWLAVPRRTLFRSVARYEGDHSISAMDLLERLGVDVTPLLDRLGVERDDRR